MEFDPSNPLDLLAAMAVTLIGAGLSMILIAVVLSILKRLE